MAGKNPTMRVVGVGVLNIRDTPNKDGKLIGTVKSGDLIVANPRKEENGYVPVESKGRVGYALVKYLQRT